MKLPPRQQPAWSHDLSFIWMLQLTFLFVAHRVVETIVVYISITGFLGSEAHVAIHQGRWGELFESVPNLVEIETAPNPLV